MKRYNRHKDWILIKLDEALRFTDLMKNSGISNFTKKFSKETNKLMGNAPNHTKLIQGKVDKQGSVTFIFATERTPKYDDNFNLMATDSGSMTLKKDNLYEIEIKVVDFFKLLQTSPEYPTISNKDVEEVLLNADILLWDTTPSFVFQGANYNLTLLGGALHPEHRPPKRWDKYHGNGNLFLSKHSQALINNIKWYIPQMRQMILKYLKVKQI